MKMVSEAYSRSKLALQVMKTTVYLALTWSSITRTAAASDRVSSEAVGPTLYPQASETRDLKSLDGIWNFRVAPLDPEYGLKHKWYEDDLDKTGPVMPMPVPSSYNDITEDASIRDHVGLVWYDRRFFVPAWWMRTEQRIWLRFSSINYGAKVWVNGNPVMSHLIGHLPFEADITNFTKVDGSNLLTVVVDNTLLHDTVPQGSVEEHVSGDKKFLVQNYGMDFFNYAGIHRPVILYSTPPIFIDDVVVNTDIRGMTGLVVYNITFSGAGPDSILCLVELYDKKNTVVANSNDCAGLLGVVNAHFWWPYLMHDDPGYMYTLKVTLADGQGVIMDTYRQKIGIRTVSWTNTTVYINDKPIYMRGFGMHEDSDIRGKGWDAPLWVKNFNLIKWIGANTFRTSHYPYAEEIYELADDLGIMIIDECPSVNTDYFSNSLLENHKRSLTQLIRRDKNHPSVIMWSIANEPRTQTTAASVYFREVANHVRSMDLSRPITIAIARDHSDDKVGKHLDVISFNRYNAWYQNAGRLWTIQDNVVREAEAWHKKYDKPVLMSEYGADTMDGLHTEPAFIWSEEYQVSLMSQHFKAFDVLRHKGWFVGEFIWNFADFKTAQSYTRVGGNKKGIFTRARQPKMGAHHLRRRYHELAYVDDGVPPPGLYAYTSDLKPIAHNEL